MVQLCSLILMLFGLFFENIIFTNYIISFSIDIRICENLAFLIKFDFINKT